VTSISPSRDAYSFLAQCDKRVTPSKERAAGYKVGRFSHGRDGPSKQSATRKANCTDDLVFVGERRPGTIATSNDRYRAESQSEQFARFPGQIAVSPTSPALTSVTSCCRGTHRHRQHQLKKNHAYHQRRNYSAGTQDRIAEMQRRAAERAEFALESSPNGHKHR
jgi:hypothetical protein